MVVTRRLVPIGDGSDTTALEVAHPEGLEPPTLWFEARYSIQLSYGRMDWNYTIGF